LTPALSGEDGLRSAAGDPPDVAFVDIGFIKFTPAGGRVRVRVRVDQVAADTGRNVLLEVSDTGMGIPAKDQETLFTRFFRASNATAHNISGTGLGLVIVRTIVENHGGTVRLDSTEGRGTTVTVALPLSAVATQADMSPAR